MAEIDERKFNELCDAVKNMTTYLAYIAKNNGKSESSSSSTSRKKDFDLDSLRSSKQKSQTSDRESAYIQNILNDIRAAILSSVEGQRKEGESQEAWLERIQILIQEKAKEKNIVELGNFGTDSGSSAAKAGYGTMASYQRMTKAQKANFEASHDRYATDYNTASDKLQTIANRKTRKADEYSKTDEAAAGRAFAQQEKAAKAMQQLHQKEYNDELLKETQLTRAKLQNIEDVEERKRIAAEAYKELSEAIANTEDEEQRKKLEERRNEVAQLGQEAEEQHSAAKMQTQGDGTVQGAMIAAQMRREGAHEIAESKRQRAQQIREEAQEDLDRDDTAAALQKEKEARAMEREAEMAEYGANLQEKMAGQITAAMKGALDEIGGLINDVVSHRTKTMARLQGYAGSYGLKNGEFNYDALIGLVTDNLRVSPYLQQQEYLKNLDTAVEAGIAYNVEQRVFLESIKEDIATTFDAFSDTLKRMVRIQQADSTANRLGMEAYLTRSLNSMFSTTEYLTDAFDSISSALIDAEANMTRDAALSFEYMVQKWLSALYSVGVDNDLLTKIAGSLNNLATGNVTGFTSDSSAQSLITMAVSRSGNDIADILVNGLEVDTTNEILREIVDYLQEISSTNSNNNVVKSAYGDIFNISMSNLKAVSNLTADDIDNLYSMGMTYEQAGQELQYQLGQLSKRFSIGEMVENVIANFKYSVASGIATNPLTYIIWEITDMINDATGGIPLPNLGVMGNFLDLTAFSVEQMVKLGVIGASTLGQIGAIAGSLVQGESLSGTDLSNWGGTEYTSRGRQVQTSSGFSSTSSGSQQYVASGSGKDTQNSAIASTVEDSEETTEITNANSATDHTFDDFWVEIFEKETPVPVRLVDEVMLSDIYRSLFLQRLPVLTELNPLDDLNALLKTYLITQTFMPGSLLSTLTGESKSGGLSYILYKSLFEDQLPITTKQEENKRSAEDLYTQFFDNKTAIAVTASNEEHSISDLYNALITDQTQIMTALALDDSTVTALSTSLNENSMSAEIDKNLKDGTYIIGLSETAIEALSSQISSVTLDSEALTTLSTVNNSTTESIKTANDIYELLANDESKPISVSFTDAATSYFAANPVPVSLTNTTVAVEALLNAINSENSSAKPLNVNIVSSTAPISTNTTIVGIDQTTLNTLEASTKKSVKLGVSEALGFTEDNVNMSVSALCRKVISGTLKVDITTTDIIRMSQKLMRL